MAEDKFNEYINALRMPFQKLCRLRFLNPDGSVAFAIDNNVNNPASEKRSKAFIAQGNLSVNFQSGQRRTSSVLFDNVDSEFDFSVKHLWFGQEIAIDEGLILPDGTDYYIQQGVFLLTRPAESIQPVGKTIEYNLVDKWANLDGTLYGKLEGSYQVPMGSDPFTAIKALLAEDKGNGVPVDNQPINNMYETWDPTPYTLLIDAGGTLADVITGFAEMLVGIVGYDRSGSLLIEPSNEQVEDIKKPIQWTFNMDETTLLGLTYDIRNEEVFNDYIIVGEKLDNGSQPYGRVQNIDPRSDTSIQIIGRKTIRETSSGYASNQQCIDLATWRLKRSTVLSKAVSVSASQIFHIQENQLIEIIRTDKEDSPIEKHLVQGFSRPLASNGAMTISAISTVDIPNFTVVEIPLGT